MIITFYNDDTDSNKEGASNDATFLFSRNNDYRM